MDIAALVLQPEYPRQIIVAGGLPLPEEVTTDETSIVRSVEIVDIDQTSGTLGESHELNNGYFPVYGYCAVTLGTPGQSNSSGLLIGGMRYPTTMDGGTTLFGAGNFVRSTNTVHTRIWSAAAVLADEHPAVCGGLYTEPGSTTEVREDDGQWVVQETARLNQRRRNHAVAVANGSLYAMGGMYHTKHSERMGHYEVHMEHTLSYVKAVERWDPRSSTGWNIDVPSMQHRHWSFSASGIDDSIYAFGGINHSTCELLDTRKNEWRPVKTMPRVRGYHSAIVVGSNIVVFGGCSSEVVATGHTRGVTEIDSYDTITDTWTTLQHPQLRHFRMSFQAFAL
jgi:hypothetical protein